MRQRPGVWLGGVIACCAALTTASACGGGQAPRPGSAAAQVSQQDRAWIAKAHEANMAEMGTGELAVSDGGSKAVRSVGAALDADHSKLDTALIKVADALHVTLPTSPTVRQTQEHDRLAAESGRVFDYDFTGTMLADHQAMISATKAETGHGRSPSVVRLARQSLPVLLKHLKMLQAVAGSG